MTKTSPPDRNSVVRVNLSLCPAKQQNKRFTQKSRKYLTKKHIYPKNKCILYSSQNLDVSTSDQEGNGVNLMIYNNHRGWLMLLFVLRPIILRPSLLLLLLSLVQFVFLSLSLTLYLGMPCFLRTIISSCLYLAYPNMRVSERSKISP